MSTGPVRAADIEVNEVADGFVVYDPTQDRVHYLNHTAALVLEFCTGDNAEDDIVRMLQVGYDLPEPPVEEVGDCLQALRAEGLIS
jgi:hypothetical protein